MSRQRPWQNITPATPQFKDWEEKWPNLPVHVLTMWCNEFIVFLDQDLDVDYKTADSFDERVGDKDVGKVLSRIAVLQAVPISHLAYDVRLAFRKMLAESLARAFHGDHSNAKMLLDGANEFVSVRNQETARRWFVTASTITSFLVFVATIPIWTYRSSLIALLGEQVVPITVAFIAGAAGALFSVLTRASKIPLDPAAGPLLHHTEGIAHIIAGMIGAVFVYLAMKAGIFAPKLIELGMVGQALACMIGGASERLVPTIIRKVDLTKSDTPKHEK